MKVSLNEIKAGAFSSFIYQTHMLFLLSDIWISQLSWLWAQWSSAVFRAVVLNCTIRYAINSTAHWLVVVMHFAQGWKKT